MMLAMGMAGEPETEVYTRAGVLFWLLHYATMHLVVLVEHIVRRSKRRGAGVRQPLCHCCAS